MIKSCIDELCFLLFEWSGSIDELVLNAKPLDRSLIVDHDYLDTDLGFRLVSAIAGGEDDSTAVVFVIIVVELVIIAVVFVAGLFTPYFFLIFILR